MDGASHSHPIEGSVMSDSRMIHAMQRRFATLKPYLIGAVVGGLAMAIVGLKAGWVVGAGSHDRALTEARINAVATVCAQQANAQWLADGKETSALEGWTNEERKALARRFTPRMQDISSSEITRMCDRILRPA